MSNKCDEILRELVGSASVCWTSCPEGVFDSTTALKYVEESKQSLLQLLLESLPKEQSYGLGDDLETDGYNKAIADCIAKIRDIYSSEL